MKLSRCQEMLSIVHTQVTNTMGQRTTNCGTLLLPASMLPTRIIAHPQMQYNILAL